MKKHLLLASALFLGLVFNLQAQTTQVTAPQAKAPQAIQYQTIIRDSSGEVVMNQSVGLQLTILQGSATGTQTYQETHTATTNGFGLVNLQIGMGTATSGTLEDNVDWSMGPYYLEVGLDLTGGSSYTVMGTTQLLSVPYALYAETAGASGTHYVGELFGGGIVFWVDSTGEHGLIASLHDLDGGSGAVWSTSSGDITSENGAEDFYDGAANTMAIVDQLGSGTYYAARLCVDFSDGGFYDWYLPSHSELELLGDNRVAINKVLANDSDSNTNGLTISNANLYGIYWSSTEYNSNNAWLLQLQGGSMNFFNKGITFRVRAVRAF
jgi:hypothetical protein